MHLLHQVLSESYCDRTSGQIYFQSVESKTSAIRSASKVSFDLHQSAQVFYPALKNHDMKMRIQLHLTFTLRLVKSRSVMRYGCAKVLPQSSLGTNASGIELIRRRSRSLKSSFYTLGSIMRRRYRITEIPTRSLAHYTWSAVCTQNVSRSI